MPAGWWAAAAGLLLPQLLGCCLAVLVPVPEAQSHAARGTRLYETVALT